MIARMILVLFMAMMVINAKSQMVDVAPSTAKNYRAVEGGSQSIEIDKVSPMNDLIMRLERPWEFVETGKAYWIGYTDNMYSIAARRDDAIKPLLNLIDTTKNLHAKLGAVYTLHLIGINSSIAGRFYENFVNKAARKALIYSLRYNDIRTEVVTLLMRDPWMSDVPDIFAIMQRSDSDCWDMIDGLLHYNLMDLPLANEIPLKLSMVKVYFPRPEPSKLDETHCNKNLQDVLLKIKKINNPCIHLDEALFGARLWGNSYYDINGNYAQAKSDSITVSSFLNDVAPVRGVFGYVDLGNKIYYYSKYDRLYICSAATAKAKLLNWWDSQPITYKQTLQKDISVSKLKVR